MKSVSPLLLLLWLALVPAQAGAAEETVTVDGGTDVKVLFFEPKTKRESTHLAILIPGGGSNTFMARAQFWLGKEFVERGWAIAVPISPDRTGFAGDNAGLLPQLSAQLLTTHSLSQQKPLLVGISSGGSDALTIALKYPSAFSGVVATPGRLQEEARPQALAGLPVYLRIGERDDFRWNRQLDDMKATLLDAGGKVDAAIVPDARHVFQLDWDNLESWLASLQQPGL
jgi:pimeloyl-ACP methyl ester carboxylesterase